MTLRDKNLLKYLFWITLIIILGLAYTPSDHTLKTGFSDKVNHIAAFAFLIFLACQAYGRKYLKFSIFLLIFGVIIEIGQQWIPGRDCSLFDLGADFIGIILGIFLDFCSKNICKGTEEV